MPSPRSPFGSRVSSNGPKCPSCGLALTGPGLCFACEEQLRRQGRERGATKQQLDETIRRVYADTSEGMIASEFQVMLQAATRAAVESGKITFSVPPKLRDDSWEREATMRQAQRAEAALEQREYLAMLRARPMVQRDFTEEQLGRFTLVDRPDADSRPKSAPVSRAPKKPTFVEPPRGRRINLHDD